MITAVHTLIYADDADAARAFFRDVLGWAHVDAHDGWLIFRTGPSELGVHPTEGAAQHHEVTLMCDRRPAHRERRRVRARHQERGLRAHRGTAGAWCRRDVDLPGQAPDRVRPLRVSRLSAGGTGSCGRARTRRWPAASRVPRRASCSRAR
ncbi:MAG TPA: VOC family protein [Pseudonocardiaceae bacterium]|nr:VOC family protein [Pseudonocardiaceae bacterium]